MTKEEELFRARRDKKPLCANCDGEGWVCENHPEVPWLDGEGCCGGAGSPCVCNPLHPLNQTAPETA